MLNAYQFEQILRTMIGSGDSHEQLQARIQQEYERVRRETGFRKVPLTDEERELVKSSYKIVESDSEDMAGAKEIDSDEIIVSKYVVNVGHNLEAVRSYQQRLLELLEEFGGNVEILAGELQSDKPGSPVTWSKTVPNSLKRRDYTWGYAVGPEVHFNGDINDLSYVLRHEVLINRSPSDIRDIVANCHLLKFRGDKHDLYKSLRKLSSNPRKKTFEGQAELTSLLRTCFKDHCG